jgi:predicted ATPase
MISPQGFSDVINGHKIWVNNEESTVYVDTLPLHNAPSNILSLLVLRYYITTATEGDFLIIEDPEAHRSEKEVSEVVSWI